MVLDNLTLGTQLADVLTSDVMTDIMNPLGGYNVPDINTQEDPVAENPAENNQDPGDPPGKKKPGTLTFDQIDKQQKQLHSNWKKSEAAVAQTKRDPRLAAGRYEYDQYVTNVDRYRGYGKSTFNSLGFNPLEDNEKYYNENTSWYQDYSRMAPHMFSLLGSSLWDNSLPVGIYNLIADDSTPGITDLEASETQARHMKLGASTRGGATEFGNNFLLNSAFSFGIIGNVVLEELAIATVSALTAPETGGGSLVVGGAAMAANARRIPQAWRAGMAMTRIGSLGKMTRSGAQMLTSINKADAARQFWQGAKGFGTGLAQFANPLRGTTNALRSMNSATGAAAYLGTAAKLSRGFGAFYRDVREFNFTLQEARLEGGGVYDRFVEEQIAKIRKGDPENGVEGREPTEEELSKIYQYASAAGQFHGWTEVPIIFATNRLVFDGLFKFKGIRSLGEAAEQAEKQAAKGIMFDAASRSFREMPKAGFFGQLGRTVKNPKLYLGSFLNYTRANFFEGTQELIQEASADGIVKYYSKLYDNPESGGANYASAAAYSAIDDQVFSMQGLNTFMNGFLMGGLIGGTSRVTTNLLTSAGEAMMRVKNPEAFKEYVEKKKLAKTDLINSMNKVISDPELFFSSARESFVTQKRANDNMVRADLNGDGKAFIDAKDEKTFDHVFTALNRGSFGMIIDGMKEMGKLSEQELAQAFNLPEGTKAKDKVQEYVKRAEQIKTRYEYFQDNMPNPFKPGKYKKGTPEHIQEMISFKAYDDTRKAAIASQYGFDRALERMNSLTSDLSQNRPIASSSASDITVLLDEKALKEEIKLLKQETRSTGEELSADQKAIVKQKTKKLEALEDYYNNLKAYRSSRGETKMTESGQIELFQDEDTENTLKKSYQNYLKYIAKLNDDFVFEDSISESFKKVMDFYELDEDSKAYNKIVNNLLDPTNFARHYDRVYNALNDLYDNREAVVESSVDKFLSINELNSMMIALGQLGIIINPEELEDMVNKGIMPRTFLDMRTNKPIEPGDSKYEAITEIIKSYKDIQDETVTKPQEEEVEQQEDNNEAQPETQIPTAEPTIDLGIGPELTNKLEDAYNQYVEQSGSDLTFEEFVAQSPTAARIKAQFNQQAAQPASTLTQPAASVSDIEATTKQLQVIHQLMLNRADNATAASLSNEGNTIVDKYLSLLTPNRLKNAKELSELYHKVKKDGSNPELVKQVDDLLSEVTKLESAALEGAKPSETTPGAAVAEKPVEKTGTQKAQEKIDSVSSIRDLFDMNSEQAVELVNEGVSSLDLRKMLETKRGELVKKISTKDLQKFDIVTFTDGSKVAYVYTKKGKVHIKTQNDAKGDYTVMDEDAFLKKIQNVEPGKKLSMEPTETTPAPEISDQDKKTVASSRDTMDAFTNDPTRLKASFDDIMNQKDDGKSAEDDLLDSLGCDT